MVIFNSMVLISEISGCLVVLDVFSILHNVKRGTKVNFDPKLTQVNFTRIIQFGLQYIEFYGSGL